MRDMLLQEALPSGNSWAELNIGGAQTSQQYGWSFGARTIEFKINGLALKECISYLLGYSEAISSVTNLPYNPSSNISQGPFKLSRRTPARHPEFPGMICTRIASVTAIGNRDEPLGAPESGAVQLRVEGAPEGPPTGVFGRPKFYKIVAQFELSPFPLREDSEMAALGLPEYHRYVEWTIDTSMETLSRRGTTWYFCRPDLGQISFSGDRLLRVPKGILSATWHSVPWNYLFIAGMYPANIMRCMGTVNSRGFPLKWHPDQNENPLNAVPFQFAPGTLLLLAPKIKKNTTLHPACLSGGVGEDIFPRTVDVELHWIIFEPPCHDNDTKIRLNDRDRFGFRYNGKVDQLIRGHNLCPLANARYEQGLNVWGEWYPASTATNVKAIIGAMNVPQGRLPDNPQLNTLIALILSNANRHIVNVAAHAYGLTRTANVLVEPMSKDVVEQIVRQAIERAVGGGSPDSDQQLLYPYSDHEWIFRGAQMRPILPTD